MRTVTQQTFGGPEVLTVAEVPRPIPGHGEVLVRLGAASVNPVDVVVRAGAYRPRDGAPAEIRIGAGFLGEPPFTLGWDVAGVIAARGTGVSAFESGDEVLGLVAFPKAAQAYSDYVVASPNELVRKPAELSIEQAGALPLAGLTAWQALVGIARITTGQRVLIHAAAGGVGHLAVQIAKSRGAHVIGTAGAAKRDFVLGLGADEVIDYRATAFEDAIAPVDVVFDLVGGAYAARSATTLRAGGLLIGAVGIDLGFTPELAREKGIRFEVVSVRPAAHDLAQLVRLVESGRLTVHVDQAIPLADVVKAHELVESGRTTGKVVLVP